MIKIHSVRGTHDYLENNLALYKYIEKEISNMADFYDFNEIYKG